MEETKQEIKDAVSTKKAEFINKAVTGKLQKEDIPEEVYKMYMRTILGNIPFEYTFEMFGGEIRVTFIEVPFSDADKYQKVVARLEPLSDLVLLSKLALIIYVKSLQIGTKKYAGIGTVHEEWLDIKLPINELVSDIESEYMKCYGELNESVHRALPILWASFNNLLNFLIRDGLPASF